MSKLAKKIADLERNDEHDNEVEELIQILNNAANLADKLRISNDLNKKSLTLFEGVHQDIMMAIDKCANYLDVDDLNDLS